MHKFLFYNKFITYLYMFRALFALHHGVKIVLYSIWYRHSVGGCPVHMYNLCTGRPPTECDDTRCYIIQF